MSKIKVVSGEWSGSCTSENDLMEQQLAYPVIHDRLQYTEKRMLTTLIASGMSEPYQSDPNSNDLKTKIGQIPKDRKIGAAGYRYPLMGRIQQESVIKEQIGSSGSDGSFTLAMKDRLLAPGMMCTFHDHTFEARVMSHAQGGNGHWVYEFQSPDGVVFDWSKHVDGQTGEKTLFAGYTSYGEKSLRGYDNDFYPDWYIEHTTVQRKSCAITGSASNRVVWITYNGTAGWMYEKIRQLRSRAALEDEHAKIWGKSNMKDDNGNLRTTPRLIDKETGMPIIKGNGLWWQIQGANDHYTSGPNGRPIIQDFKDIMEAMKLKANNSSGNKWYVLTGPQGMAEVQEILKSYMDPHIQHTQKASAEVGGGMMEAGYTFVRFNYNGNQIEFVEHPLFGDQKRFTKYAVDGTHIMGGSYLFLDANRIEGTDQRNIEIKTRGAYGGDRTMVSGKINGLTGAAIKNLGGKNRQIQTSVDADEYHILKEDGIFVYNAQTCGILHRSAA